VARVDHPRASIGAGADGGGGRVVRGRRRYTAPVMLGFTPDPILVHLGPLPVYWYGICYALGLVAVYIVLTHEATRKGLDAGLVGDGMIVVAIAALIGGRLYHVIDRWDLYQGDLIKIFLPPYTGLGVFGGLITGTIVAILWIRHKHQSVWAWMDAVAPALFAMQAIGRWGNFFNQELYGPPTSLPWGIPIECQYRIADFPCATYPFETTRFTPLFLYESLSAVIGLLLLLWLGRRMADRLRPGDLLGIFFIWYGAVRFMLEGLRSGNWTFNGIPTAWLFAGGFIAFGALLIVSRHLRPGPSIGEEDARRLAERSAAVAGPAPDDGDGLTAADAAGVAAGSAVAVDPPAAADAPAGPTPSDATGEPSPAADPDDPDPGSP
jgi:phosphatidylglycerol:prolipoprotein diacylglycerol transferase